MRSRKASQALAFALAAVLGALTVAGCGEQDRSPAPAPAGESEVLAEVTVDRPLEGAVFPPEMAPPTFLWHDAAPNADVWSIRATFEDGDELLAVVPGAPPSPGRIDPRALSGTNEVHPAGPYEASARSWTPSPSVWNEIKRRSTGTTATVTILGSRSDDPTRVVSRGCVHLSTSKDPVGAPIFYRDVPLMPAVAEESGVIRPLADDAIPLIEWRLRDIALTESKVVLTDMPSCANCHSFSLDGRTLAMDVDGPTGDKGAYAIAPLAQTTVIGPEQVITWNSFPDKPEGHKTIGFLSRISPDGKYALTTLNESLYVANFPDYRFLQVFYPTRGILAWYSVDTGEMKALPGADDERYVHTNGVWTPDGKGIVFSRAEAFDPYLPDRPLATRPNDPNEPEIRYDLYRMPFNDGKGGTPVAIEGASDNDASNTFPKVSPDGKWIVFTKCRNGQLMRPDGKLWIVPLEGGEAREMRCNTSRMNSWHSFSPNGRWMVFSSKENTPYTQMFLTHIDENGRDSPRILVPNATAANRAVNIPEFVGVPYDALERIEVPAVAHHRLYWQGIELLQEGRYADVLPVLEEALEAEPTFSRTLVALGLALLELGRTDEAIERFRRAIELDPTSSDAHANLGLALSRDGLFDEAIRHYIRAIERNLLNGRAHHNLALALSRTDRETEAVPHFERALELESDDADIHSDFGFVLHRLGQDERALALYRRALALDPDHLRARKNLGYALLERGEVEAALQQYQAALRIDSEDVGTHRSLGRILLRLGRVARALGHLEKALSRAPDDIVIRLDMAWLLATSPDDDVRNGSRALALAQEGRRRMAPNVTPALLDVLAAALAEVGRFEEATALARQALEGAGRGEGRVAPGIEERIRTYEASRPYRQPPRSPKPR